MLSHDALAQALLDAVRQALAEAPAFDPPPSLDLAVVTLPPGRPAAWANVLFSREWPRGLVAQPGEDAGSVRNIAYFADPVDAERNSIAWLPGADWTRLAGLRPLAGPGPHQFIAPYPASLIKLMVAVAVARLVDTAGAAWDEPWSFGGRRLSVAQWAEPMITVSDNDATSALVALLHARGLIHRSADGSERNALHTLFDQRGLHTLRLANTRPDGGWLNRDGAGVGQLQMTAWDTARLLWLLLPGAEAPWLPAGTAPLLSEASAERLWQWLGDQALHEVLSSTLLAGLPGWQAGIPARLPVRWLGPDGRAQVGEQVYPPDLRPAQAAATLQFAHKTGNTASYASDAGLVTSLQPGGRRYLIALTSTLGARHAPHPAAAAPWCLPRIGALVDRWIAAHWA
jgi:Beta-lactamase enzyme family